MAIASGGFLFSDLPFLGEIAKRYARLGEKISEQAGLEVSIVPRENDANGVAVVDPVAASLATILEAVAQENTFDVSRP